jgi:hypothetical protein
MANFSNLDLKINDRIVNVNAMINFTTDDLKKNYEDTIKSYEVVGKLFFYKSNVEAPHDLLQKLSFDLLNFDHLYILPENGLIVTNTIEYPFSDWNEVKLVVWKGNLRMETNYITVYTKINH